MTMMWGTDDKAHQITTGTRPPQDNWPMDDDDDVGDGRQGPRRTNGLRTTMTMWVMDDKVHPTTTTQGTDDEAGQTARGQR